MPSAPYSFLVIDDNPDSRFLLVKTLVRKFPEACVLECQDGDGAVELARREDLAAIITHRATEIGGIDLLRQLRTVNSAVPIVMVSSIDRRAAAHQAGANAFLLYDEWLRIGTVVAALIRHVPVTDESMPPFSPRSPAADLASEAAD
jgi:DNA-binding NarL/FixJ family response regulator